MFTVSQNDYGYYITDTLLNNDGTAFDLTNYSVAFHVWHPQSPGTLLVNGAASIVSQVAGTVRYFVAQADFKKISRDKTKIPSALEISSHR